MAADNAIPLPLPGSPVTLVIDDDRHVAVIEDVEDLRLDLKPVALPERVRLTGVGDGYLEFVSTSGPCRLRGTAAVVGEGGRVRFDAAGAPQLLLRSDRVRAPVEMVIDVAIGDEVLTGQTRDLRGAGVLIAGPLDVELGAMLRFGLHLPGRDEPVHGWGRVARIAEDGDVALSFQDVAPADQDAILLAVFAAQRGRR